MEIYDPNQILAPGAVVGYKFYRDPRLIAQDPDTGLWGALDDKEYFTIEPKYETIDDLISRNAYIVRRPEQSFIFPSLHIFKEWAGWATTKPIAKTPTYASPPLIIRYSNNET